LLFANSDILFRYIWFLYIWFLYRQMPRN